MYRKKGMLVLIILALSLFMSPTALAPGPGSVKFKVVEDFPELIYAGSTYEAEYLLENMANRPASVTFNLLVEGPDLEGGEFTVTMFLDGFDLEVYETEPGEFFPENIIWRELEPKAEISLVVGVTSVPNVLPAEYTLTTELRILAGKIK